MSKLEIIAECCLPPDIWRTICLKSGVICNTFTQKVKVLEAGESVYKTVIKPVKVGNREVIAEVYAGVNSIEEEVLDLRLNGTILVRTVKCNNYNQIRLNDEVINPVKNKEFCIFYSKLMFLRRYWNHSNLITGLYHIGGDKLEANCISLDDFYEFLRNPRIQIEKFVLPKTCYVMGLRDEGLCDFVHKKLLIEKYGEDFIGYLYNYLDKNYSGKFVFEFTNKFVHNSILYKLKNITNWQLKRFITDISYILENAGTTALRPLDRTISPTRRVLDYVKENPIPKIETTILNKVAALKLPGRINKIDSDIIDFNNVCFNYSKICVDKNDKFVFNLGDTDRVSRAFKKLQNNYLYTEKTNYVALDKIKRNQELKKKIKIIKEFKDTKFNFTLDGIQHQRFINGINDLTELKTVKIDQTKIDKLKNTEISGLLKKMVKNWEKPVKTFKVNKQESDFVSVETYNIYNDLLNLKKIKILNFIKDPQNKKGKKKRNVYEEGSPFVKKGKEMDKYNYDYDDEDVYYVGMKSKIRAKRQKNKLLYKGCLGKSLGLSCSMLKSMANKIIKRYDLDTSYKEVSMKLKAFLIDESKEQDLKDMINSGKGKGLIKAEAIRLEKERLKAEKDRLMEEKILEKMRKREEEKKMREQEELNRILAAKEEELKRELKIKEDEEKRIAAREEREAYIKAKREKRRLRAIESEKYREEMKEKGINICEYVPYPVMTENFKVQDIGEKFKIYILFGKIIPHHRVAPLLYQLDFETRKKIPERICRELNVDIQALQKEDLKESDIITIRR